MFRRLLVLAPRIPKNTIISSPPWLNARSVIESASLGRSVFSSMPPKRKAAQAAGGTLVNGAQSNGDLNGAAGPTPVPVLPAHPTDAQIDHVVDIAVENSLRKRRRTNPVSYAEPTHDEEELDMAALAEEAADVAAKTAAAAAAVTPKKATGKNGQTPRKTAKQKQQEEEEEDYNHRASEEEEEHEEVEEKPTPKKRGRKKAVGNGTPATPAKQEARDPSSSPLTDEDGEKTPKKGKKKTPKKPTPKKSRLAVDEPEYDEDGNEIVKKKRKPKVYPKIEYDIPDVERLETTFKGELHLNPVGLWLTSQVAWVMHVSIRSFGAQSPTPFSARAPVG